MINTFTQECLEFWTAVIDTCPEIRNAEAKVGRYRDQNGGHLFFRPIALYPFAKVAVRIKEAYGKQYIEIIRSIPDRLQWIQNLLWKKIIWDDVANKMIMGNATLIELLLLYIASPELLTPKEKSKLIDKLKSVWDEHNNKLVQERLDSIIRGDEYV